MTSRLPTLGYRGDLPPARFNMAAYVVGRAAANTPHKPALIVISDPGQPPAEIWTYAEIEAAILGIAGSLRETSLQRGARLLIRLENSSTYALLFFGAVAAGLVPLPVSSQLTAAEFDFLLEDSGAAAVALADDFASVNLPDGIEVFTSAQVRLMMQHPVRASYADTAADDPAYLIYTSGTTSRPKGVIHGHRAAWGRRPMYAGWYGITETDRVLHAGAFNWTYTLGTGLTDPWANGATAIVYTGPKDPAVWPRLITAAQATIFAAVPSLYRQMLRYADVTTAALGPLRHGLTAGETPPPGLFEEWAARTGRQLYEALGMSEMSTYVSSSPTVPPKSGTVGKPQPGRCVAILPASGGDEPLPAGTEGLLAVHRSDPGLMLGYWNRPEEEAEVMRGDWFIGGDLASMDTDGYITHHGRANDIMKALGYRVAPQEVEAVLAAYPGIAEVACAEIQVRADVSVIGAFIVLRENTARDPDAIKHFASERLAAYKCPREIVFVEALPRTANGKLRRGDLKAWRPNGS